MNLLVYFIKLTNFLDIEICALLFLCSVEWYFRTDISGNISVPFSGVLDCLTSEDEIDSSPQTSVRKCHILLCVKSKKGADLIDIAEEA